MSAEDVNTKKEEQTEQQQEQEQSVKSEKKVRKALGKLGMTKVENVNRVTIRQKDNYILIVKDPEVYSSDQTENTMIIFGEVTFDDPDKKLAKEEMEKMRAEGDMVKPEASEEKKETVEIVDENEEVSEEGLNPDEIETVMSESKCSRKKAARALKANNNDVINAILSLTESK